MKSGKYNLTFRAASFYGIGDDTSESPACVCTRPGYVYNKTKGMMNVITIQGQVEFHFQ